MNRDFVHYISNLFEGPKYMRIRNACSKDQQVPISNRAASISKMYPICDLYHLHHILIAKTEYAHLNAMK